MLKNRYFCILYKNNRDTMFPQLFHRALLVCVLLACSVFVRAQFTTLVRITDPGLIPVVDTTYRFTDGVDGVRLVSEDPRLNEILQSFTFYDFAMLDSQSSNPAVRQYFVFRFYSTGNRNRFRREIEARFGNSFTEWSEIFKDYDYELHNRRIKIVAAHSDVIYALRFTVKNLMYMPEAKQTNRICESGVKLYSSLTPKLDSVLKTFKVLALLHLKMNQFYIQFASEEDKERFAVTMPNLFPDEYQDITEFTKEDWVSHTLFHDVVMLNCSVENIMFTCEATFLDKRGRPIPRLRVGLMDGEQKMTNKQGVVSFSVKEYHGYTMHDYPHYLVARAACGMADTIYVKCKISRCSIQEEPGVYYDSREFSSKFVYTMYPTSQNKWKKRKISEQYDDDSYSYYDSELNHQPYFENKVSSEAIRQYFRANRRQTVDGTNLDWRYGGFSEFSFLINKKGEIVKESITLISGGDIQSPKNQELIRLLTSMPRWTPAVRNGKRVECRCEMYIDHLLSRTSNLRLKFFYP